MSTEGRRFNDSEEQNIRDRAKQVAREARHQLFGEYAGRG